MLNGYRVKERLPDYVVTMADQIVNVDLSAEDLDLVRRARLRAFDLIERDPVLEEHPRLLAELRARFERRNRQLGITSSAPMEFFNVTGWGAVPKYEQLLADLPGLVPELSRLDGLRERLARLEPYVQKRLHYIYEEGVVARVNGHARTGDRDGAGRVEGHSAQEYSQLCRTSFDCV